MRWVEESRSERSFFVSLRLNRYRIHLVCLFFIVYYMFVRFIISAYAWAYCILHLCISNLLCLLHACSPTAPFVFRIVSFFVAHSKCVYRIVYLCIISFMHAFFFRLGFQLVMFSSFIYAFSLIYPSILPVIYFFLYLWDRKSTRLNSSHAR